MGSRRVKIGASNNGNNKVVTEMPNFVTPVPLPTSNPMSATSIAVELNKSSRRISSLLITELSSLFRQQYQNFLLWKTNRGLRYTTEQIDEVRAEWAKQVMMFKV